MSVPFKANERISQREAHNMVVAMALYGDHSIIYGSESDIEAHFALKNQDLKRIVAKCRDFSQNVPFYENLFGTQWTIEGGSVLQLNHNTGDNETIATSGSTFNFSNYSANFEISKQDFDSAISSGRWERFLAAVGAGIAAVEAFLNHQYIGRLQVAPDNPALRENLEAKIKTWPKELTGQSFDLSKRPWSAFSKLKKLRDDGFQHTKSQSTGVTFSEHLALLNEYKHAVPKLLLDLHIHYRRTLSLRHYTLFISPRN